LFCFDSEGATVVLEVLFLISHQLLHIVGATSIGAAHTVVGHVRERILPAAP
jgi:hypothetical protein